MTSALSQAEDAILGECLLTEGGERSPPEDRHHFAGGSGPDGETGGGGQERSDGASLVWSNRSTRFNREKDITEEKDLELPSLNN